MSNWTAEQEAAITTAGCDLLVSAAAGAGKTAVLVERIIRRLVAEPSPLEISRLLVVTFTNAAAQEMKERIGEALLRRSRENPSDENLKRQLLLLGKASISTLHAFCLELIRQNYYRLALPNRMALDPRFRIADDIETVLVRTELLEELFEDKYNLEDPLFLKLVDSFGGERDDRMLAELVLKLYEFSRSHPEPEAWLANVAKTFRAGIEDAAVAALFGNLTDSITLPLAEARELLSAALEVARRPDGPTVYQENLLNEIRMIDDALDRAGSSVSAPGGSPESWLRLTEGLRRIDFSPLKSCRGAEIDKILRDEAQGLRNAVKKIITGLQKVFLARSFNEYLADMEYMAPLMEALCRLAAEFGDSYLEEKLKRNILDFSDIEHFALALLRDGDFAGSVGARYEEVLIDEYQDINNVQEAILSLVAANGGRAGKMFMVGDVKQSIYGFRLAEPGLFLAKYHSFAHEEGARQRKIVLARNFRSRPVIIAAVNYIFRQLMSAESGGLVYDSDAELICGAEYPLRPPEKETGLPEAVEVYLLESGSEGARSPSAEPNYEKGDNGEDSDDAVNGDPAENGGNEENGEELAAAQLEARVIGLRIEELIGSQVWDKEAKKYRPASYRDMVVLMRSTKKAAQEFAEEFRRLGLPVYSDTGLGYLEAEEVQTMLALLRIIDNPRQDIPLIAVLRSAMAGLTAAELAQVRLCRREGDFYDALRAAAWKEKHQPHKLREFLRKLRHWRTYARRNSVAELVWLLFRETGYYDYAGALAAGKQKQANLRALYDRAKQYENTTLKGLFRFLRFLEKLGESGGDLGAARALGEKEDVVRIMSIHKSKGLEFPIVFLAGLGRKFNQTDLNADILLDKELGLGPVWVDSEKRLKYPTLAKIAVKNKQKRDLLAEEIRILYVGMTRAREALILVGSVGDIEKKVNGWRKAGQSGGQVLPPGVVSRAASYYDWLGPCLLRERADNPPGWELYMWRREDIRSYAGKVRTDYSREMNCVRSLQPVPADPKNEGLDEDVRAMIEERLGWQYPAALLADIPAKLSVTEIKNRYRQLAERDEMSSRGFGEETDFIRLPLFMQEAQGLSAAEKGSALHIVMRNLKLDRDLTEKEITRQITEMVTQEIITREQGDSVEPAAAAGFFGSDLGRRLKSSGEVLREVPFTLALDAAELYSGLKELPPEKIIVQGTLDCLFAWEGGYILVDYKTDRIEHGAAAILKERYHVQMALYARAVEAILGKPVLEKYLFAFATAEAVKL